MAPIYSGGSTAGAYPYQPYSMRMMGAGLPGWQSGILKEYTRAFNEGRAANEQRYADILAGYRQRYDQGMAALQGWGDQQIADTKTRWKNAQTQGMQSLVNSGLANTTVAPSVQAGYQRRLSEDLNRVNESLNQQRIGLQNQLSGDTLQFMERRQDEYPSMDSLMQLAMGMGRGDYGGRTEQYSSGYVAPPPEDIGLRSRIPGGFAW